MRIPAAIILIALGLAGCQFGHPVVSNDGAAQTGNKTDVSALTRKAEQSPGEVRAWISLGNALFDTNRWVEAIEAYRRALALDAQNVDVRVDLGTCYRSANMPESAIKEYRIAIEIDPRHKNARRNAGVVLAYDLNKPDLAIIEFEKYLELDPDSPERDAIRRAIDELKDGIQKTQK